MKLSLLILALAVSMATGFNGYPQSKEAMEDYFTDDSMKALVESLFATQQEIEGCACMKFIDLWVKTSTVTYAASGGSHQLQVSLANSEKRNFTLSGLPEPGQSKLYTFDLDDPAGQMKCVSIFDIKSIAINAISTDGWNINSATTVLEDTAKRYFTGSIDRNINAWVDHEDLPKYERLELSLTGHN